MDVISSSTTLPSDLNSADAINETGSPLKSNSISEKKQNQEDIHSNSEEIIESVNNVENSTNEDRSVKDVLENEVDSENVNELEKDNIDIKDSVGSVTNSVSDTNNICELSHLEDENNIPEKNIPDVSIKELSEQILTEIRDSENPVEESAMEESKPEQEESISEDLQKETVMEESKPEESISEDLLKETVMEESKPEESISEDLLKETVMEEGKSEEIISEDLLEETVSVENVRELEEGSVASISDYNKNAENNVNEKTDADTSVNEAAITDEESPNNQENDPVIPSEEQTENENSKALTDEAADPNVHSPKPPENTEEQSSKSPEIPVAPEITLTEGDAAKDANMEIDDDEIESAVESKKSEKSKCETTKDEGNSVTETAMEIQEITENSSEKSQTAEVDSITEIIESEETSQTNFALSEVDDQSMDQDLQQENPLFVHVGTKADGENEGDKSLNTDLQNETGDEIMEVTCLSEEDPIGINQDNEKDALMDFEESNDKETLKVVEFNDETITSDKSTIDDELVASKGADEELCIIPDTDRVISQEEKDAATAAAAAAAEQKEDAASAEASTTRKEVTDSSDKPTALTEKTTTTDEEFLATVNNASTETSADKPEIKVIKIPDDEATEENCHQCSTMKKCVFKVDSPEKSTFICSETCLISFRTLNKPPLESLPAPIEVLKVKDMAKKIPGASAPKAFLRKCSECSEKIKKNDEKVLSWETMDFCNEDCLSRYQNRIGSHCANCKKQVLMSSLGKYCVRFGHDIRQFCCSMCLEEFKKGLKVCSYCQKDISGGSEGFLAPVGDKGQFKDFCTQLCMEKFDQMNNKASSNKFASVPLLVDIAQCSVCKNEKQVQVHFDQHSKGETKRQKFCSAPCFVAFKFVNQADPVQCDMCRNYFENDSCTQYSIYYESMVKNFCCKTCQNIYIIANRRIVPCSWCKVKKYNFDMIKKSCHNGQVLMMCSLNCLSLFQVSVNAVSSKRMRCDFCTKISQAQYHLTMSDATIRNFCTYHCVMSFQGQFSKLPITLATGEKTTPKPVPVPASGPKKYSSRGARVVAANETATVNEVRMPVITNVESLANNGSSANSQRASSAVKINNQQAPAQTEAPQKNQVLQQIIVKAPPLPPMKNAATMCKPILHTKGVSCRPHACSKDTQTETIKEKTIYVPVPVPIYVPTPVPMFSAPVPVPIPFPLPIPVPVFIPTTRNSASGIMKEIKKIQVKIPTDPFEAEILMMAEMVAGEKKVENTDSESEEDDNGDAGADGGFSPEPVDTSTTFGDDMLQMALKIATELDEPAVDLEGALTANTITASQNQDSTGVAGTEETVDDPQPMHQLIDRQNLPIRGRKRSSRQPRSLNSPAKRGRRMSSNAEMPMMPPPQPSQPQEPIEKPDANMCLKYTFGVNAWKQWVTTKNADLEKSSRRVKLFKNEILQLTADELNYSLCLFVKEVRKPNGSEYAPDTIYYLCLGIQQYLFENGRIDNIFTDTYYEKFTDCLDEVARKFSVLYNDSHYIVTRVEEEHLWESKQLGAHSPHVLLSTLMFFNTKHFNLTTVDEHMQLSFSHIMKHWKRNPNQPGAAKIPGSRNVLLRFYPPQTTLDSNSRKKKVYEQQENEENPLRCPVKLYEFYLSKCPESVKTRNDVFYLLPERSCVPDSPVWYSTMALGREALEKMLHRVKMVKEINVALLTISTSFGTTCTFLRTVAPDLQFLKKVDVVPN